jgi:hypothetical protein
LTSVTLTLLRQGRLQRHFAENGCSLDEFHQVYCYVFYSFDQFWTASKPKSVMEFGEVLKRFTINLNQSIAKNEVVFVLKKKSD